MLPNTATTAAIKATGTAEVTGAQHVNPGPVRVIKGQTDAGEQQIVFREK